MTRYRVRLYTQQADELRNRHIECNRKEMPIMLARFVLDYLKDTPYPGAIQAIALAGSDTLIYMIKMIDDTVTVYQQVFQRNTADMEK